tara:strand:- start:146 stop:415 length:270 start_codon:yes stop_codon:yes gene_type:complete
MKNKIKTHEIKNDIMHTMLELGKTYISEGELNLRIDWFRSCGCFLTGLETFDLKIARGEKLSPYEKKQHKQLKQDYKDTRNLIKSLESA